MAKAVVGPTVGGRGGVPAPGAFGVGARGGGVAARIGGGCGPPVGDAGGVPAAVVGGGCTETPVTPSKKAGRRVTPGGVAKFAP